MKRIVLTLLIALTANTLSATIGTVIKDTITNVPCRVYLPADVIQVDGEWKVDDVPVLYLQHGMWGDEHDWTVKGDLLHLLDSMQQLYGIQDRIIIMPDNCPHRPTSEEERANATSGYWEQHFHEFMAEAESRYPVSQKPAKRAIAGLSMGGYHTMRVSALLDGEFAYIGMFSPATMVHEVAHNYKLLWIAIGTEDFLYQSLQEYLKWLDEQSAPYTYYETGGGHVWPNWQDYLCRFLIAIEQ